jgi:hypothetical protein
MQALANVNASPYPSFKSRRVSSASTLHSSTRVTGKVARKIFL